MDPVLRYPGAKWSIADWIIQHFPPHTVYLEPFFGSGAVFFCKKPSKIETVNDIDGEIVNLFRVIREKPQELASLIEMTPWARQEYILSFEKTGDPLEDARRFLVRCWQAHGSNYVTKPGWRNCVAGRDASYTPVWAQLPRRILEVAYRLKNAQIENQPAIQLIERYKSPEVLIYCDPPYLQSTRSRKCWYSYEMSEKEHIELLEVLNEHPGPVIISGYENPVYDSYLKHWHKESIKALSEKGRPREEVIWLNPVAAEYRKQISLFIG
ncbi:MAG: adenine methylase [Tepidanaerobacteraceae bacterium]|nr:adenine methylase [Tepidanaerobacteraceae bacterium]